MEKEKEDRDRWNGEEKETKIEKECDEEKEGFGRRERRNVPGRKKDCNEEKEGMRRADRRMAGRPDALW